MKHFILIGLAAGVALIGGCATSGKSYESPEAASAAFVDALSPLDDAKIREVLGSRGAEMVHAGDLMERQASLDKFVQTYRTQHELVEVDASTMVLEVGPDNWPLPIPLVRSGNGWRFDLKAGEEEIIARHVGRNELNAMQTCRAIVDAQHEYAAGGFGGATGVFATRFVSSPGTRDGLVWPTNENEPPSPLGPFLADVSPVRAAAVQRGAEGAADASRPFHGYIFRILRSQGPFAPGGAMEYMQDGRMSKGFAVIASPAKYGKSGIMTFMVNQHGVLYERDLGSQTASVAAGITSFNPTTEWLIVPHDWE